jgi:hypothetical protein
MAQRTKARKTTPTTKAGRKLRTRVKRAERVVRLGQDSAQTIAQRGLMMSRAVTQPDGFDNPEFSRMVTEKVFAGGLAQLAMAQRLMAGQGIWTAFWFQQMTRAMQSYASGKSSGHLFAQWVSDCSDLWMKSVALMETAMDAGARPIHRVAAANARRLGRMNERFTPE